MAIIMHHIIFECYIVVSLTKMACDTLKCYNDIVCHNMTFGVFFMTHFLCIMSDLVNMNVLHHATGRKFLFNDELNAFHTRLHGVGHIEKDHSDSETGNLLLSLHEVLFALSSK